MSDCIRLKELHAHLRLDLGLRAEGIGMSDTHESLARAWEEGVEERRPSRGEGSSRTAPGRSSCDDKASSGVYMQTWPDGMRYVGQAFDMGTRMRSHRWSKKCPKVAEWAKRYGWDSVRWDVLLWCSKEDLDFFEQKMIAGWNTQWPNGLNRTAGGNTPDPETVKESWRDPGVREKHVAGRKRAWADPVKRANIMNGRAASAKVAAAKDAQHQNTPAANAKRTATWEAKRETRLERLSGKARVQRIARMDRDRERARRKAEAKRTQALRASSADGEAGPSNEVKHTKT